MKTPTALTLAAVLALGLTACTSDSGTEPDPSQSSTLSKEDRAKARKAAGLPDEPTGQARADYLAALRAIDPWFVDDKGEEDAISNGVNQCRQIDHERAVYFAQQRFGAGDIRPVTEAEAERLNDAVRKYICPED